MKNRQEKKETLVESQIKVNIWLSSKMWRIMFVSFSPKTANMQKNIV